MPQNNPTYLESHPEAGDEGTTARNVAAQQESHRNEPARIVERLKASLPQGTTTEGSFAQGGTVPKDGAYQLHAGEQVSPATQPLQQDSQTAQNPPEQDDSNLSEDESASGEGLNLQRAYSKLNAAVRAMFDGLGIPRSATIPHQKGQSMSDHLSEIGQVMASHGQITGNIMTATHSVHDSDGGSTVGHPNQKLMETKIPKDSAEAKAAVLACRSLISKCEKLIGETSEVQKAKAQLQLLSKNQMAGMSAFDAGIALLNIPGAVIQALARAHSLVKHGRIHPVLTAPKA